MNTPVHQTQGLWKHPRDRSSEYTTIKYWQELARTLERGLFDGIFLADITGLTTSTAEAPTLLFETPCKFRTTTRTCSSL